MIQADVRRHLRVPVTADFHAGIGQGSGHMGDRVYRVVGHVDSQNGFGALLRVNVTGHIEYFPIAGSWRMLELSVDG